MNKKEACELLEFFPPWTVERIRSAFIKKAQIHSPERSPLEFQKIYSAYQFLLDELERSQDLNEYNSFEAEFVSEHEQSESFYDKKEAFSVFEDESSESYGEIITLDNLYNEAIKKIEPLPNLAEYLEMQIQDMRFVRLLDKKKLLALWDIGEFLESKEISSFVVKSLLKLKELESLSFKIKMPYFSSVLHENKVSFFDYYSFTTRDDRYKNHWVLHFRQRLLELICKKESTRATEELLREMEKLDSTINQFNFTTLDREIVFLSWEHSEEMEKVLGYLNLSPLNPMSSSESDIYQILALKQLTPKFFEFLNRELELKWLDLRVSFGVCKTLIPQIKEKFNQPARFLHQLADIVEKEERREQVLFFVNRMIKNWVPEKSYVLKEDIEKIKNDLHKYVSRPNMLFYHFINISFLIIITVLLCSGQYFSNYFYWLAGVGGSFLVLSLLRTKVLLFYTLHIILNPILKKVAGPHHIHFKDLSILAKQKEFPLSLNIVFSYLKEYEKEFDIMVDLYRIKSEYQLFEEER